MYFHIFPDHMLSENSNPIHRNVEIHLLNNRILEVPCVEMLITKHDSMVIAEMFYESGYNCDYFKIGMDNYSKEAGNRLVGFLRFCIDILGKDRINGDQDKYEDACRRLINYEKALKEPDIPDSGMTAIQKKHVFSFQVALERAGFSERKEVLNV